VYKIHYDKISAFDRSFWDLWIQKLFRNFASVKYQWLMLLYLPVVWGMFNINSLTDEPWISATLGLSFLGGGFVTLALGRIISRTRLTEDLEGMDTDK
jgi:hypothetical protein